MLVCWGVSLAPEVWCMYEQEEKSITRYLLPYFGRFKVDLGRWFMNYEYLVTICFHYSCLQIYIHNSNLTQGTLHVDTTGCHATAIISYYISLQLLPASMDILNLREIPTWNPKTNQSQMDAWLNKETGCTSYQCLNTTGCMVCAQPSPCCSFALTIYYGK